MAESHQARAARTGCALPAHLSALVVYAAWFHPRGVIYYSQLSFHITMAGSAAISLM